jgi:hypothetical protein
VGTFTINVSILDHGSSSTTTVGGVPVTVSDRGGQSTFATSRASVNRLTGTGFPISATEDVPFTGTVAAFTNPNLVGSEIPFTSTIDWGDGTTTSGTVTLVNGTFLVSGSHTYTEEGSYAVQVSLIAPGRVGGVVVGTASTTATVAENFTVTNTNDSGKGSLRDLINDLNGDGFGGTITFRIPGSGPFVIHVASPLPAINVPVVIDGASQPGFSGTPIVVINGAGLSAGDGLTIAGGNTTVRDLAIDGFANGVGVVLEGRGGDALEGNFIGTDASGTAAVPNFQGVLVLGSSNNRIGGADPRQRNVISGNLSAGIQVFNSITVSDPTEPLPFPGPASGNVIEGNFIGTTAGGRARLGDAQAIFINDAAGNVIGGAAPGAGNVISGNRSIGVQILGDHATGNVLAGNFIGTDLSGRLPLGNNVGVFIYAAAGNVIGQNDIAFNAAGGFRTRSLASGPEVESLSFIRNGAGSITGVLLTFTTYLDRARASDTRNYFVSFLGRNLRIVGGSPVVAATYNGIFRTVQLTLGTPVNPNSSFEVRVVGTGPRGVTDRLGNPLDGSSILPAPRGGSDFLAFFTGGKRVQIAAVSSPRPTTAPTQKVAVGTRQVTARSHAISPSAVDALIRKGAVSARVRRRPHA